jgi:hypothetical protein
MFGDDEEDEGSEDTTFSTFENSVFIDLLFQNSTQQRSNDSTTAHKVKFTVGIACTHSKVPSANRLENSKRFVVVLEESFGTDILCDFIVAFDASVEADLEQLNEFLLPGGLMYIDASDARTSAFSSLHQKFDLYVSMAPTKLQAVIFRKHYIAYNNTATVYWNPEREREETLLRKICIPLSSYERKNILFHHSSHSQAVKCLQEYGVCVFKGLFPKEVVQQWGNAAIHDMKHVLVTLRKKGIDLLGLRDENSCSNEQIENYHEMSMREARRCDIRNGKAMTALHEQISSHQSSLDIRNHPGVVSVLTEVANAERSELAAGNWGSESLKYSNSIRIFFMNRNITISLLDWYRMEL